MRNHDLPPGDSQPSVSRYSSFYSLWLRSCFASISLRSMRARKSMSRRWLNHGYDSKRVLRVTPIRLMRKDNIHIRRVGTIPRSNLQACIRTRPIIPFATKSLRIRSSNGDTMDLQNLRRSHRALSWGSKLPSTTVSLKVAGCEGYGIKFQFYII